MTPVAFMRDGDLRPDLSRIGFADCLAERQLTYFWVGVGGALGSIGRYWMAMAVTMVTGPAFPWGTILINVLGSFIIGLFGTLTTSGGKLTVPSDARVFVMVGICGGFTTFSSFSLQTLDLAREGRLGHALGNIGLSVVLCLLAVAAGYAAAVWINGARSP
jgi:CrcB protein